LSRGDLIV